MEHLLFRRLVQVPLLLAFELKHKSIDVIVVGGKTLLNLAFDGIRCDIGIDTCVVLEQLVAKAHQLRQTGGELMGARQPKAAFLYIKEVEKEV